MTTKSISNSTSTPLTSNLTFKGSWDDITSFKSVTIDITSNVDSADGGIKLQWSPDKTTVTKEITDTYTSPGGFSQAFIQEAKYFRIVYTSKTSQTSFNLTCYKNKTILISTFILYFSKVNPINQDSVLSVLTEYVSQQWFQKPNDPSNTFEPLTHLIDANSLISSGFVPEPVSSTQYIYQTLNLLINYYSNQAPTPDIQALLPILQNILVMDTQKLEQIFVFPYLDFSNYKSGDTSVPLIVTYNLDSFDGSIMLSNFYQDSQGSYTLESDDASPMDQIVTIGGPTSTKSLSNNMKQSTIHVQFSFMAFLRYCTVQGNSVFKSMSLDDYSAIIAGDSVPIPKSILTGINACRAQDLACPCLYFVTFDSYECMGFYYYYSQFNPDCKCIITRAVPFSVPRIERIHNKFGQCFDFNCSASSSLTDCSQQCEQAKEWFQTPNWFENIIDPAAVDIDKIESTCKFKIPQFARKANQLHLTWKVITGAICMILSIPVMVLIQSLKNRKFTISILQVVGFVLLIGFSLFFGYTISGIQKCTSFGESNKQAPCVDRLFNRVPLNHNDCDDTAPIFCQCDASQQIMRTCFIESSTCKCQNNQACIPGEGVDDMLVRAPPETRMVEFKLLYLCLGFYILGLPLLMFGMNWITQRYSHWISLLLHIVVYVMIFSLIVILPVIIRYMRKWNPTWEIDSATQSKICNI